MSIWMSFRIHIRQLTNFLRVVNFWETFSPLILIPHAMHFSTDDGIMFEFPLKIHYRVLNNSNFVQVFPIKLPIL